MSIKNEILEFTKSLARIHVFDGDMDTTEDFRIEDYYEDISEEFKYYDCKEWPSDSELEEAYIESFEDSLILKQKEEDEEIMAIFLSDKVSQCPTMQKLEKQFRKEFKRDPNIDEKREMLKQAQHI